MVDAGGGIRVKKFYDLAGEVSGPGRLPELVGYDAYCVVAPRESQHGLGEVGPSRAVEPGGAHDVGAVRIGCDGEPFTLGLGAAIRRDRVQGCRLVVWRRRRPVEHVVSGDLNELGVDFRCRDREVLRASGVDGKCVGFVGLRIIHLRVRGCIDHYIVPGDRRTHGIEVGDVEVGAAKCGDVPPRQRVLKVLTEHACCTGDEVPHSAARSFKGSHQTRLSRYHCTTSASPCSNGTCGLYPSSAWILPMSTL